MIYKKQFFLLCASLVLFSFTGCKEDDNPVDSLPPNESELLIKYIEGNGDYINSESYPALISAKKIREGQLNQIKQIVLDLRTLEDFSNSGHIEGAIQLNLSDVPAYYKEHNLDQMDRVIVTCLTGLHASYAASLLRLQGYKNVFGMVWGMSSWNTVFDHWTPVLSDNRASQFETTLHEKNSAGSLPNLNTGKSSPEEILKTRAEELMVSGFDNVGISNDAVFSSLDNYYIVNYASLESYLTGSGHVPKAVQYTPVQDFNLSTNLKTLPGDKTIVLYCGSSHGSAQMAAYLNLIGYNVKVILYGNNGMNYSTVNSGKKFGSAEINDYPYLTGTTNR